MKRVYSYKFRDKEHPPVPNLQVGDKVYAKSTLGIGPNYDDVSTCEIRKVEVIWHDPNPHDEDDYGYWYINYYIRTDVDRPGLKSTKIYPYHTGEEGGPKELYMTPQEVMDMNIREFLDSTQKTIKSMRKKMLALGYTEEQSSKLLEYKPQEMTKI